MSRTRALIVLCVAGLLAAIMAWSAPALARSVRFGLEFRGGYELSYTVTPKDGSAAAVTPAELLATADVLRQRCDGIGMAEPELHLEGANHIRLKLVGTTDAQQLRSRLSASDGLPTRLIERYSQTVGSVLGQTALQETLLGGAIGVAAIVLLLLCLYRGLGLVTAFSLMVYLWLLVLGFTAAHATLSLSGVVAFVLGLGMAADASIICLERMREAQRHGSAAGDAIRIGFRASLVTIVDANAVTALAMAALFVAGIGPIQGFAVTMLASIVISFITCFVVVRTLGLALTAVAPAWFVQRPFTPTTDAATDPETRTEGAWSFVRWGRRLAIVSVLVVILGAWSYSRHGLNLDIDFTAGTALDIDLPQASTSPQVSTVAQGITADQATTVISDAGTVPATVTIGGADHRHIAARFDQILAPAALQRIIAAFQARYGGGVVYEENTADPGVARAFASHAVYALLAACVGIFGYLGLRFTWAVGLATLIVIVHDLIVVTALFALFRCEIDVTYIAAMLTILGYSLNDKIVIFGRIRQHVDADAGAASASPRVRLQQSADLAIRQTLGRSIYTVLTVVLASAALLLFGCEPLQMFALALLLGLLIGCYSSLFLTAPVWIACLTSARTGGVRPAWARVAQVTIMLALFAVAGGGVWWSTTHAFAINAPAQSAAGLGDLRPFQVIAEDTQRLLNQGEVSGAKVRIKELESAWDQAQEQLEPKDPAAWMALDKAIDRALRLVRSGSPDPVASAGALRTVAAMCGASAEAAAANAVVAPAAATPIATSAPVRPLGDLSAFIAIADETLRLVQAADLSGAKARITDLESAWDDAEKTLRTQNPGAWTILDDAIDQALVRLRARSPEAPACAEVLQHLLSQCWSFQGP